jgi:hypothetical protein
MVSNLSQLIYSSQSSLYSLNSSSVIASASPSPHQFNQSHSSSSSNSLRAPPIALGQPPTPLRKKRKMEENEGEEMIGKNEDEEENGRKINGKKLKIEKDEEEDLKEKDGRREQNIFDRMTKEEEDLGEKETLEINNKKSAIKRRKNGKLTTDNKKEHSNLR